MSLGWPGNLGIPLEQLDKVAGEREVPSLLRLLPSRPRISDGEW